MLRQDSFQCSRGLLLNESITLLPSDKSEIKMKNNFLDGFKDYVITNTVRN